MFKYLHHINSFVVGGTKIFFMMLRRAFGISVKSSKSYQNAHVCVEMYHCIVQQIYGSRAKGEDN